MEIFSELYNDYKEWLILFIGLVFAFCVYKKTKVTKEFSYQKYSLRLIDEDNDNLPDEVAVMYDNRVVSRLTKTTLIFWNSGTTTIDGNDIVETDSLSISFKENDRILNSRIINRTREINSFVITPVQNLPNKLNFGFNYLDHKDGATVELLHDSEDIYPEVSGTIKGLRKGFVDQGIVLHNKLPWFYRPRFVCWVATIFGFALIALIIWQGEIKLVASKLAIHSILRNAMLAVGLFYALTPAFLLWIFRKRYPKELDASEIEH